MYLKRYWKIVLPMILCTCLFVGCGTDSKEKSAATKEVSEFSCISMEEAAEIFHSSKAEDSDYIILDVRHENEYAEGHLPGAILIDNDEIHEDSVLEELPDKEQTIYVYCRSGNRSKQAAKKLVQLGYTNIIEIGGIMSWSGEIEK